MFHTVQAAKKMPITMRYEKKNINKIEKYTFIPVLFWSPCNDTGRNHV